MDNFIFLSLINFQSKKDVFVIVVFSINATLGV